MWYKITPNDTLFFRDGKPFTMGAETWAEIIFPPNPSTMFGAIRSWLIFEKGDLKSFKEGKFKEELGTPEEKGSLAIKGPFLMKDEEILFISPYDLLVDKDNILYRLTLSEKPPIFISNYPIDNILIWKGEKNLESGEGFITETYMKDYLSGKDNPRLTSKDDIYVEEQKIGIAREGLTKTTKEGHLYRMPMIRLKRDVSITVKIEGVGDIPDVGILQLGGEGRTARIEKVDNNLLQNIEENEIKDKFFKLYFATPTIFKNGWLPEWIDRNSFEGAYNGIKLKLLSCSIGKYRLIGGWDMAKGRPKPMHRAIPAGSVFYFEILDSTPLKRVKEVFHFSCISQIYPEEGFGLSLIGQQK